MKNSNLVVGELPQELQRNWGWLLGLGILFIILGTIGLGMVVSLTLVSVLFFGVLLIIAGFFQIADTFKCRQWKAAIWHALIGLLYVVAGGSMIYDPILASTVITALIAWVLIGIGISRLLMAFSLRQGAAWGWFLVAGCVAILLGILILTQWPYSGLWVLGMFIAIDILITGWTYIFLALAIRRRT